MLIEVSDPVFHTILFSITFLGLLLVSLRINKETGFSKETTNQLKGLAILAIVFSHIGYFLSTDQRFLFPLSVDAGVGVNLFLFLSGFGLTFSQINSPLSIFSFYKKRLIKLFIPLWVVLLVFLTLDFFILHRSYPLKEIIENFLGIYKKADLFWNINSPLWYFSIIFFYYLIFPITFIKKLPLISPILVLLTSLLVLRQNLPVDHDLLIVYKLHFLAFPLGMTFAILIRKFQFKLNHYIKWLFVAIATGIFLYTSIHSGVGEDAKKEQTISILTALLAVLVFSLSRLNFKLLSIVGIYSYEIYLLHWPILSRFNLFLGLPPFLDITLNLLLIFALGYGLQKLTSKIQL